MKTRYRVFLSNVEKAHGYEPKHIEIAEVLVEAGVFEDVKKGANTLANRYYNDSFLKQIELDALREHFFINHSKQNGAVWEIPYWEGCKDCIQDLTSPLLLRPKIEDRQQIEKVWVREPNNLRLIALPDNRMDGGCLRYRQGDLVCIDIADNNQANEGIYFYIYRGKNSKSKKFVASVAKMRINFDGNTEVVVENPLDPSKRVKILNAETIMESNFKIVGRVIFNYSQTT